MTKLFFFGGNIYGKHISKRGYSCWEGKQFDCVASTGNSLSHVQNADVLKALEEMDSLVKANGYLYLDMRNWEKILHERNRFFLYNPVFPCRNLKKWIGIVLWRKNSEWKSFTIFHWKMVELFCIWVDTVTNE